MTRWQIDYIAKQARSAVDDLYKQCIEIEEAHTSIVGGQVMKLQKYPWVGNSVTYYSSPDLAIAAYDKEFEACKKVHEENLKAIANNTNIKSALFKLLENLGVRKTYTNYNTRSHKSKSYNWPRELGEFIPTSDNWDSVQSWYKSAIDRANKIKSEEEDKRQAKLDEAEREKVRTDKIKMMGILANKYDLDLDANQDDILEKMCILNKYLGLAHGLLENREDWSDGPESASYALRNFKIETPLDQEIYDSIAPYVCDWCGDGRIYRDMEWNYGRIFKMVEESNPSLYSDYQKLMEIYIRY